MKGTLALVFALSSAQVGGGPPQAGSDPPKAGGDRLRSILGQETYQFCHDERYPLLLEERGWCALVGERSEVCPALPKACQAAASDPDGSLARRLRALPPGASAGGEPREPPGSRLSFRLLPEALSSVAAVLFVAAIAAGVAALGWVLWKAFGRRGDREDQGDAAPPPEQLADAAPDPKRAVETDVGRLLAQAEAAAARGDYDQALAHAHAALLRRLEGEGLIELHPCRTNGDHVRALRDRAPLQAAVREICRDVERAQFGAAPASQALYRSVYQRVAPLATRALGAALLCLSLGAGVAACQIPPREGLRGDASPSGTQAIAELLTSSGVETRRRTRPLSALRDDTVTLVLLGGTTIDPPAWEKIFAWVRQGGVFVAAGVDVPPEWTAARPFALAAKEPRVRVSPSLFEAAAGKVLAVPTQAALRIEAPSLAEDAPSGAQPLLFRAPEPSAAGGEQGEGAGPAYATYEDFGIGTSIVFADGALFTNIALTTADNGAFLVELLAAFERPVELCDSWTGAGASTPLESLNEAHLTPVLLQLFALAALLLLWKGVAFGALRDPPERARRAFVDHVRALGLCYARARAARHVSGLYAGWALDRLRERVQRRPGAGLIPLAEAIAARTGRPEPEIVEVLVDAQGARERAGPPSSRAAGRRAGRDGRDGDDARELELLRKLSGMLAALGSGRGRAASGGARRDPHPESAPPRAGGRQDDPTA